MRRVVTGVNEAGRSYVVSDEELAEGDYEIWDFEPADVQDIIAAIPDGVAAEWVEAATPGGAKLRHTTFPPASSGFKLPALQGFDENGWHVTRTFDFDYVVAGQITLLLDEDSVVLHAGDYVVQQATRHAWRNDGDENAVLMAMMMTPPKA
jgi:hypothetical protein